MALISIILAFIFLLLTVVHSLPTNYQQLKLLTHCSLLAKEKIDKL